MLHTQTDTCVHSFYKYNMFARVLLLLESSCRKRERERRRMGFCAHFKRIRGDCNIWDPRRFMFFLFYYCSLSALLLHAMLFLHLSFSSLQIHISQTIIIICTTSLYSKSILFLGDSKCFKIKILMFSSIRSGIFTTFLNTTEHCNLAH